MALTGNFDYCVQLTIEVVRELFHQALKDETVEGDPMFPHNLGPFTRDFSGRTATIYVKLYDDIDRPADLTFADEQHIRFSIPFDLDIQMDDAPDPALSRMTIQARAGILGLIDTWENPLGSGEHYLGIDFSNVTPTTVDIDELINVPTVSIDNYRNAIHKRYDQIDHIYEASDSTLVLYDGSRDLSLSPSNETTPFEIEAQLETHGGTEYLKITAPFHLTVLLPAPLTGTYQTYGRIVFWRRIETSADETHVVVHMDEEPGNHALESQIEFDSPPSTGDKLSHITDAVHSGYLSITHEYPVPPGFGPSGRVLIYDDDADTSLDPYLDPGHVPYNIEGVLETHVGSEYIKLQIPVYVELENVPVINTYSSFGHVTFWRELVDTGGTVSVDMSDEPTGSSLKTTLTLDSGMAIVKDSVAAVATPYFVTAIAAFGTISAPGFSSLETQMMPLVLNAIGNFGKVVEPTISDAAARTHLKQEIANYMVTRQFPVYTPVSPDPDQAPLDKPVGRLLVADEILAVLFNQRSGAAGTVNLPDNFTNGHRLAVAIGRARADELVDYAIRDPEEGAFPNIDSDDGQRINTPEGSADLKELNVSLADAGTHGQTEGHFWITGMAEVHIDCWPDPDVEFEGPVLINSQQTVDDEGQCSLELTAQAGDFDFDQSCCDVFIDVIIPIVGWIMYFVIESTVESVGGRVAGEIADAQAEVIDPVPPVVFGVAKLTPCLVDFVISSQGFVMPGEIDVRRDTRSFEDLETERALPRP